MRLILKLILSCTMIFVFTGISRGEEPESTCVAESNRCKEACDQRHSTPKRDVWGNARKESDITRWHREKCKNSCLAVKDSCIKRKRKLEDEQKAQEELEDQAQESQEYIGEETSSDFPQSSDKDIYRWTDENGVLHMTNNINSIPPEYLDQVEQSTDYNIVEDEADVE